MDFSDDIALVIEGIKEAQEMITQVEKSAKRVGLSMNTGKLNTRVTILINSLKSKLYMGQI